MTIIAFGTASIITFGAGTIITFKITAEAVARFAASEPLVPVQDFLACPFSFRAAAVDSEARWASNSLGGQEPMFTAPRHFRRS